MLGCVVVFAPGLALATTGDPGTGSTSTTAHIQTNHSNTDPATSQTGSFQSKSVKAASASASSAKSSTNSASAPSSSASAGCRASKNKRGPLKSGCFGALAARQQPQRVFCGRIERHGGLEWSSFRATLRASRPPITSSAWRILMRSPSGRALPRERDHRNCFKRERQHGRCYAYRRCFRRYQPFSDRLSCCSERRKCWY